MLEKYILERVQKLIDKGFYVFPVGYMSNIPAQYPPHFVNGHKSATQEISYFKNLKKKNGDTLKKINIGVRTGREYGLYSLDVDAVDAHKTAVQEQVFERIGVDLSTFSSDITPGGAHYYFLPFSEEYKVQELTWWHVKHLFSREEIPKYAFENQDEPLGIELKAENKAITVAPGFRKDDKYKEGASYKVGRDLCEYELLAFPPKIIELFCKKREDYRPEQKKKIFKSVALDATGQNRFEYLKSKYGEKALERICAEVASLQPKNRNAPINEKSFQVGQLVQGGFLEESSAYQSILDAAIASGHDPLSCKKTVESGFRSGFTAALSSNLVEKLNDIEQSAAKYREKKSTPQKKKSGVESISLSDFPDIEQRETKDGNIRTKVHYTQGNFDYMCKVYGYSFEYEECNRKNICALGGKNVEERYCLTELYSISRQLNISFPKDMFPEFLDYRAYKNSFHSVKRKLDRSGVELNEVKADDYFQSVFNSIRFQNSDELNEEKKSMYRMLFKKWCLQAYACLVKKEGFASQGVLVLQGDQGIGKTSFFRELCSAFDNSVFVEGMLLNTSDKDKEMEALSSWICELGEVDATFRKSDIAALKAFITKEKDIIRPHYARKAEEYPRRTVFCATVNKSSFLNDETGNRRFWVLPIKAIDFEMLRNVGKIEFWKAIEYFYKIEGISPHLNKEQFEFVNEQNRSYEQINPLFEAIEATYNFDEEDESYKRWVPLSEVVEQLGIDKPSRRDSNEIAYYLRQNGVKNKKMNGYNHFFLEVQKKL